jgi:hypothetical protein
MALLFQYTEHSGKLVSNWVGRKDKDAMHQGGGLEKGTSGHSHGRLKDC